MKSNMPKRSGRLPRFLTAVIFLLISGIAVSQSYDTISNWDAISADWQIYTPGSAIVNNPAPGPVNSSEHCLKFVTTEAAYDYMLLYLPEPANLGAYPRYHLKVLAPASGGNITLKFENYNNFYWQEIVKTPTPGQWTDLVYDFSGLPYNDLIKMVIFPDFEGTTPGKSWYIDDVLRENNGPPLPLELETNLPIMVINTYGEIIKDDPKIDAHLGVIDNGPGEINHLDDPFNGFDGMIGIEIRGQSSQTFFKNSYAVETRDSQGEDLDVALLGMPEESDWVLYAPYSDKSMLRNFVSFETGRKMGNYCTRSVFFELVINGDYKGVYTLMEKIKRDENRVDIATLNPEEITGDEHTGGYIIKVDKVDPDFVYGEDGWKSNPVPAYPNAMDITFQYFYPEAEVMPIQQKAYIKGIVTVAENTLTSTNFSDPEEGYQKYFDVPSFIDFMLLNEMTKEVDKYRYSNYLYKEKDSDGGKLFAGPAWDFDLGYGNVDYWEPGLDHTGWLYTMVEPVDWGIMFWWKRLMEDPYFKNMAKTRWNWLRQNILDDESMHQMIDSLLAYTEEAKDRNYERWPILGTYVWPNNDWYGNDYEDEVDYFEDYLFSRLQWMDSNMPGTLTYPYAGISASNNTLVFKLYNDFFRRKILLPEQFRLNNAPQGITIQEVSYMDASTCRLTLSGNVEGIDDLTVTIKEEAVNYWLDITSSSLSATGINDDILIPEIKVYNENQRLHIVANEFDKINGPVEVYNSSGQKVMAFEIQDKTEISVPHNLTSGIYFVRMIIDCKMIVRKFSVFSFSGKR